VTGQRQVLVTGGAGYVGSIVVDELLEQGYRVRVLDALLHGSVPSLLQSWGNPRFEFAKGDVRDAKTRKQALEGISAVVHLAAIVGDPACARQPELASEVNLGATKALLRDAERFGVERFVFASTCSNYGRLNSEAFATEDFPLRPISLYAETKVAGESQVLSRANEDFCTVCLRFATVFGISPRMRFDLTVNEFTRDVSLGAELIVFGEQFWRPYVHVRDAAQAVVLALETPADTVRGAVFNVGDNEANHRKLDIVELLRERFPDARVSFVHKEEDPRDYRVAFDKVRAEIGFRAERTVADGIDELISLLASGLLEDPYAPIYRN
jgi:nucleoside-diphosphate-sugar epimerase